MSQDHMFAGPGKVFVRDTPDKKGKKLQHLVWGDYVSVLSRDQEANGWLNVRARGEVGWMALSDLQSERLLEINFVDVGQGDGAFLVTPDDEFGLVDAGVSDNMRRFLSWRFNLKLDRATNEDDAHEVDSRSVRFSFAVISHSDQDHYEGFSHLFGSEHFRFDNVYHNTLVERQSDAERDMLGRRDKILGRDCVVELIESHDQLSDLLAEHPDSAKKYIKLLRTANESGRVGQIVGVTSEAGHLDGFDPGHTTNDGKPLSIEVLGPISISDAGRRGLPTFGDPGVTKNGHSVVLRVNYGSVRVLLGGDLNTPAEEHLLEQRTGRAPPGNGASPQDWIDYLDMARISFGADIAKSCHHGSADFSTVFIRSVNAAGTVISSGDEEPYCHPRPDTLGALGRHSRGDRPAIFSTELMRSAPEWRALSAEARESVKQLLAELDEAEGTRRDKIKKEIDATLSRKERAVAVYGMISLRTDGERVVISQKLEKPATNGSEFYLHWFEPDGNGELHPVG